jgi:WD40 repeat protein
LNPLIEPSSRGEIPDLAMLLARSGTLPESQIWAILRSILPALHEFHCQDRVYQTIQPATILAHGDGTYGLKPRIDRLGLSPEYAAPEQLQRQPTFASDFYSLGVTCIHLLTGVPPFDLWDIVNHDWVWQSRLSEPLSARLTLVLDRMIRTHWVDRYASVEDVMRALGFQTILRNIPKNHDWQCIKTLEGHEQGILSLAWDESRQRLFSAGEDRTLRIWNLAGATAIWPSHPKPINSLALHPSGNYLATASDDRTIQVWDVRYQLIKQILVGHRQAVKSVLFTPDGTKLISASWDKTIRLWDWATGIEIQVWRGHTLPISAVAITPDGEQLASASHDRTIRLWDMRTGETRLVLEGHTWAVTSLVFSADGKYLATGSDDRTIRVWDVVTGHLVRLLPGHAWSILALAFHPQGQALVSGSWNPPVNVWQWSHDQVQSIAGHDDFVTALVFNAVGDQLFTAGRDRSIKVWQYQPNP